MSNQKAFRVLFTQQNEVYEVYTRHVYQSSMLGFIELEEFVFGSRSKILVDPSEDKLKSTFGNVKRSFIPINAVIRIDEVDQEGQAKISQASSGKITHFPLTPQSR